MEVKDATLAAAPSVADHHHKSLLEWSVILSY